MPPLPDAPKAIKCTYQGSYLTATWVNVFYVTYSLTTPVDADLATLAGTLGNAWNATLGSISSNQVTLTKVTLQDVSRNPGAYGESTASKVGSGGVSALPANVAIAITKKVARRYRGGHPRLYLCGIPAAYTADGRTIVAATLTAMQATVAAWRTQVNAATSASTGQLALANVGYWYTPVPHQPPVLRPTPVVEAIISCSVNQRLDSQRRRLGP